jgi:hypothetical protein
MRLTMCAKRSLQQPVRTTTPLTGAMLSLTPGNTIRSGYPIWRLSLRGVKRSPVRNDSGRNALSGVKVSSPVKREVPKWPSYYEDAKAIPVDSSTGTSGVQVHGMNRRLLQELGRSPWLGSRTSPSCPQGVMSKCTAMPRREVRGLRSSKEVG